MPHPATLHIRRLVLPVYLPMVLLSLGLSFPVAAFPQYLSGLGATVGLVGLVVSLEGFGHLLSDLPGGLVLGRFGLRRVVLTVLSVAVVATVAMALARSVAAIAVFVLITGLMTSVVTTAMMTYVRIAVPADTRGTALAFVGGAVRFGALLGPLAGGLVADALGVPLTIGLRAACFGGALAVTAASPDRDIGEPKRETGGSKPGPAAQARAVAHGLRGRWYALITVGFVILMLQFLRATRNVVLPLWGDRLTLSATTIGSVMSIGTALDLLLFVPAGLISDRRGRRLALGLCVALFTAGLGSLSLGLGFGGFVAASLLIGLGNGFGAGINMTVGVDLAPSRGVSEFLGMWRLYGDLGASLGPAVVGAVAAAAGLTAAVVATAGLGLLGLGVLVVFAPETLSIARETADSPQLGP